MEQWTEDQYKEANLDSKVVSILYKALTLSEFMCISHCDIAFKMCKVLTMTSERTKHERTRSTFLMQKFGLFCIEKNEMVSEMHANFNNIIVGLKLSDLSPTSIRIK